MNIYYLEGFFQEPPFCTHKSEFVFQLTSNRAPPPRNRRGYRPDRKTQSENLDELLKKKPNELLIDDFSIQRTMAKTENPVLVKVKNERIAKSLDNLDKNSEHTKDSPFHSPKTLAKTSSSKANKQSESSEVDFLFTFESLIQSFSISISYSGQ